MKSRKEKFIDYQEKFRYIPKGFRDRLEYMCDIFNVSERKMNEILHERERFIDEIYYKELFITLYECPEGTPRPRARLVNRYNILDESKKNSEFIQIYSITGKSDNAYMKRLVTENQYVEAGKLIYTPCDIEINLYFETPSSFSVSDKFLAEIGVKRPIKKPDWDNAGKKYSDMYNGNIWVDDRLVIDASVHKYFSILPRVEISLLYSNKLFDKSQYKSVYKDIYPHELMVNEDSVYFGG